MYVVPCLASSCKVICSTKQNEVILKELSHEMNQALADMMDRSRYR